jgi:small subunit ribosomal protein S17
MGKQKEFTGTVISTKMQKTALVRVMQMAKHSRYARIMKSYNKYKAHDEKGIAKVGDTVLIIETRPLSKDKHFRIAEVIKKAQGRGIALKEEV